MINSSNKQQTADLAPYVSSSQTHGARSYARKHGQLTQNVYALSADLHVFTLSLSLFSLAPSTLTILSPAYAVTEPPRYTHTTSNTRALYTCTPVCAYDCHSVTSTCVVMAWCACAYIYIYICMSDKRGACAKQCCNVGRGSYHRNTHTPNTNNKLRPCVTRTMPHNLTTIITYQPTK